MLNKENSTETTPNKNKSENSEFLDNSYYQNETKIEYPFYVHNASESHTSISQGNSRFTMSIGNPVHAAKAEEIEKNIPKKIKSLSSSLKPKPSIPLKKSETTSSKLLRDTNGKRFELKY